MNMISQHSYTLKWLSVGLSLSLSCTELLAEEDPASFLKFSTDFDAKCVIRGGVMIYISNTHSTGKIKVLLERWYMNNRTADRGRSVLMPGAEPEALGCSLVSKGKQEWRVLESEWEK
ncbi:hypothetical protein N9V13_01795 [Betaproteobacteria bacterium]|nr:hypothetical protein [Betaproteobacteria bacterium]